MDLMYLTVGRQDRHRRMALAGGAAAVLLALACQNEPLMVGNDTSPQSDILVQLAIGSCSNFDASGDSFTHHWNCGISYTVKQSGSGPDMSWAISAAASNWSLGYGLPSFSYTSSSTASINVVRHGTSSTGKYCGTTATSGAQIDVYPKESSTCTNGGYWTGTAFQLLLHEFGHAVGLGSAYHNFDVAGYSDQCAMNLPSGTSGALTASALCPYEKEEVYSKYGVRPAVPNWGGYMATGIAIPVDGAVTVGTSTSLTVDYLLSENGNAALTTCPANIPVELDRCFPLGTALLSWSASPSGLVTLSGGSDGHLTVTGVAGGTVTLTATLVSTGGYETSTPFESAAFKRSVTMNVIPLEIAPYSGSDQTALVSTALPSPLVVQVLQGSAPAAGEIVTFAVESGGGSLSATLATTDASGLAQTSLTLGPTEGTQSITASLPGATGSPVTFYATALPLHPVGFAENDCNNGVHTFTWSNTPGYSNYEIIDNSVNDTTTGTIKATGTGTTADIFYKVQGTSVTKYLWIRNTGTSGNTAWAAMSPPSMNVSQCLH